MKLAKPVLYGVDLRRPPCQKILISCGISPKIRGQPMSQNENIWTGFIIVILQVMLQFLYKFIYRHLQIIENMCTRPFFSGSLPFCNVLGHIRCRPVFFVRDIRTCAFLGGVPEDLVGEVHTSIPLRWNSLPGIPSYRYRSPPHSIP